MDATAPQAPINLPEGAAEPPRREIRYEHSLNLGPILDRFGVSLLGVDLPGGQARRDRPGW